MCPDPNSPPAASQPIAVRLELDGDWYAQPSCDPGVIAVVNRRNGHCFHASFAAWQAVWARLMVEEIPSSDRHAAA